MGRGSTQSLIRKILVCLAKGPRSIKEISDETRLDRTSIVRYLNILKDSGLLSEEQNGTNKIFHLSSTYRTDTYFGLPLDEETNEQIDSLYYQIREKWKEITGRKLLKTTAQKIMYKIIRTCELKIPIGWYIYGGICVKPYDYNAPYDFTGLKQNVINCVNETVAEYSKYNFAWQSKQQQYEEADKDLYSVKEKVLSLLYSKNFSKNSMFIFQKEYARFIRLAPEGDAKYNNLIEDYMTIIIDITQNWDDFVTEERFAEFKQTLLSSFEALWKLVAIFNYKNDLLDDGYYLQSVLDEHFKLDIAQAKEELIQIGSELNSMIPHKEPDDPVYKKVKEALSKANEPVSDEELMKQNKELDKIEKEQGIEALGKELRRRTGLE